MWTITFIPRAWAQRVMVAATLGILDPRDPDLGHKPDAGRGHLVEVFLGQPFFEHHRPGMNLDPGRAQLGKGLVSEDGEGLHPGRIGRPPRGMGLPGRDHGRHPSVKTGIDEVDLALAGGVVADHRMDVVVAQTRHHGRTGSVDHVLDSIGARTGIVTDVNDHARPGRRSHRRWRGAGR